ncbi:uncharacterized protein LOC141619610 [Silene latifolia]|uniref:uncharacterized protein LOC141619610 n=1 Tax=Silene latifolia TaxID=37657 RepID=UPI003D781398
MSINCSDVEQFPPLVSGLQNKHNNKTTNTVASSSVGNSVVIGGPSGGDVQKTKNVNEMVGVQPYDLDSIHSEDQEWIVQTRRKGKSQLTVIEEEPSDLLRFTVKDVKDKHEHWKNSVYCFILSANPPVEVVDGFIKRIWSLIARPWRADVELVKEDVKEVPVWVRLEQLPLKFWGKCLPKIEGLLGKFVQTDIAMKDKTRLGVARIIVEVPFGRAILENVKFMDEEGLVVTIKVEFEWKPLLCTQSKKIIRISRQELLDKGQSSENFGTDTFLESLNTATLTIGIGVVATNGSGLPPNGDWVIWSQALNSVRNNLCANWYLSTNTSYHKGGRVWVLWNPSIFSVNFLDYSAHAIHAVVKNLGNGYNFYFTMVYPFNDVNKKKPLWFNLGAYNSNIMGPWVICGDFNTVLVPSERLGDNSTFEEMDDFQKCVNECGLADSSAIGPFYTWSNKQDPSPRVFSRLDRLFINSAWLWDNGYVYAHFYTEGVFDHTPCVVQTQGNIEKPRRSFKYYNMWSKAKDFKDCVSHVWRRDWNGSLMFNLVMKLKCLKWSLK